MPSLLKLKLHSCLRQKLTALPSPFVAATTSPGAYGLPLLGRHDLSANPGSSSTGFHGPHQTTKRKHQHAGMAAGPSGSGFRVTLRKVECPYFHGAALGEGQPLRGSVGPAGTCSLLSLAR